MKMKAEHLMNYMLNIIYPEKCLICESVLPLHYEKKFLCKNCESDIPWINGHACRKCGRPLMDTNLDNLCGICINKSFSFEKGYAVFEYDVIKASIKHFKYKGFKKDGHGFSWLMYEYACKHNLIEIFESDFLVPVPIFHEKKKIRGFNQAEILSNELSKYMNKPILKDILLRKNNTVPQSELSFEERKKNISGAFEVIKKEEVENKNIILIDDIFTTGSTVNECSRELYKNGASKVYFFALSAVKDSWL